MTTRFPERNLMFAMHSEKSVDMLAVFKAVLVLTVGTISGTRAVAQGCIASRGTGLMACPMGAHHSMDELQEPASSFEASVSYRWLHSDRMFSYDVEQTKREAEGSQEINDSNFIDFGVRYNINPRYSVSFTLPYSVQSRSEVVRRLNLARTILGRFETHSSGIGDLRLEGNAWLLDPVKYMHGNVQLGIGVSAPSGERDAQDLFAVPIGTTSKIGHVNRAVDQSIQLGNGGWGMILDLYAYRQIVPRLNAFVNGYYTITPEEKYTPTNRPEGDYSIADSYLGRAGLEWVAWPKHSMTFSVAGRVEGVPVHDLVGGSDGFRRPGYAISIEPGVSASYHSWTLSMNAPVALYRNREQSISEQAAGLAPTAAGFADFVILCSLSKKF